MDQVIPYLVNDRINLEDTQALIDILENAFGDPDKEATATRKLTNLRQTNKDFATYYAEFARYAADVDWSEKSKLAHLRNGLSAEWKQDLITRDEPSTLVEFVTLCQKMDSKRRMWSLEHRSRATSTTSSTSFRTAPSGSTTPYRPPPPKTPQYTSPLLLPTSSTATGTHAGPMDLSSNRHRLTPGEQEARIREGRYLYCGGHGHIARVCPNKRPLHAHDAQMIPEDTPASVSNSAPSPAPESKN